MTGKVVMKTASMIKVVVRPVKIRDARQIPREDLLPGQTSLYRYVGFSTGKTKGERVRFRAWL